MGWPKEYDFNIDKTCQEIFKPFIEEQLADLKSYDRRRPEDVTYIFHEHAERVAGNMRKTCLHMGLGKTVANNMYWALLPHDIGKKQLPVEIWDTEEKPAPGMKKFRRTHTLLGAQIVQEYFPDIDHPFKDLMIEIMRYHHEEMNGHGTHGIPGDQLSKPVRLAAIVEAYDGWRIWRPHYGERDISIPGVLKRMREEKGPEFFDMELFEAFAEMKMNEYNSSS
jgi:HD-GYP domain-containing protein (c-di-GMP phosphodiesterase class II)